MNEEIVVILDANQSMGEELHRFVETNDDDSVMVSGDFLGTSKFDVARCIVQELMKNSASAWSPGMDHTRVLALITLGEGESVSKRNSVQDQGEIWSWGGCCGYITKETDHKASTDWIHEIAGSIHTLHHKSQMDSDFVTGIILGASAMLRNTTVGAGRRRILLLTDARHKVLVVKDDNEDPMEPLLEAMNALRQIGCILEVVGMGFRENRRSEAASKIVDNSDSEMESDGEFSESNSDDENDWSNVQEQNEILIVDLVEKLGGGVQAVNFGTSIDCYCVQTVVQSLGMGPEKSSIKETQNYGLPSEVGVKTEIKLEDFAC